MACKGCLECLLKLLNFLLTLVGLAMVGYGIFLFVEYKKSSSGDDSSIAHTGDHMMLMAAVSLSSSIFVNLPKLWFIYLFIGFGVVLFIISCFGCIGASTGNGCCLSCYSVLVVLLILVELGCAAFMFFDKSWKEEIPIDKTGDFDMIYGFLREQWKVIKWVALGIVILEALVFLLALVVRSVNTPPEYDSDDEYISGSRQQIRQPLINRPPHPATGVPVVGPLDQLPGRSWNARMREKYGLDEAAYDPATGQPVEVKSRCTVM